LFFRNWNLLGTVVFILKHSQGVKLLSLWREDTILPTFTKRFMAVVFKDLIYTKL